jgi:hypothetical protein
LSAARRGRRNWPIPSVGFSNWRIPSRNDNPIN